MNYSAPKAYFFDCATKSARIIGLFQCQEVRSGPRSAANGLLRCRGRQRMVYSGAEVCSKWVSPVLRGQVASDPVLWKLRR